MASPIQGVTDQLKNLEAAVNSLNTELPKTTIYFKVLGDILISGDGPIQNLKKFKDELKIVADYLKKDIIKNFEDLNVAIIKLENTIDNFSPGGQPAPGGQPRQTRGDREREQAIFASLYFTMNEVNKSVMGLISNFTQIAQKNEEIIRLTAPALDMVSLQKGIYERLNASLNTLVSDLDKTRQEALAMGTSFDFAKQAMDAAGLADIGGFGRNVQDIGNFLKLYSLGFRQSNQSVQELAKRMDMTGQKTALLLQGLTQNSIELQLSNKQLNSLAKIIEITSASNNVTSEQLIEAIGGLKIKDTLGFLGTGGAVAGSLAQATAQFPQLKESMLQVVNSMQNPKIVEGLMAISPKFAELSNKLLAGGDMISTLREMGLNMKGFMDLTKGGAQQSGLPSVTFASMFAGDLLPLMAAFTQIISQTNSEARAQNLEIQQNYLASQTLTAQMQQLQGALIPLAVAILNVTQAKLNEAKGATTLVNVFVQKSKDLLQIKSDLLSFEIYKLYAVVAFGTIQLGIGLTSLIRSISAAAMQIALKGTLIAVAGLGALVGLTSMIAGAIMLGSKIKQMQGIVQDTGGVLDTVKENAKLNDQATQANTDAINKNNNLLGGESGFRRSQSSSYFSDLSRSMQYVLTQQESHITALSQLQQSGRISVELQSKMVDLLSTGVDIEIRNTSSFAGAR